MKLRDIDILDEDIDNFFITKSVPISAINFHAYSCITPDGGFSHGISYLSGDEKETKFVCFQLAEFNQEIKEGAVFIGALHKYAIHVYLIP
jgi:hypothetical protein